ncbi:hypothetical protein LWI29_022326 [Acer saccharum]|uniref:Uncharacterized protein n=1 Tax=Acer saccharum TaxID=4024 RepID=A0AA39VS96_ACESA|nr:hypothetical protein LWI29_022326 [Acer saccharum]
MKGTSGCGLVSKEVDQLLDGPNLVAYSRGTCLEAPVQAHLNEIEAAFVKANFGVDLDKQIGGRRVEKEPISILSEGLKGGSSICVEGELKGTSEPSLSGKKGVINIIERNCCSGKLERNSTMLPIYVNCPGKEVQNKVGWSLEEEIVKVLKKGMAIGFEFNGKKKELLEIINSRKKEDDRRFHDLVRNLVQKLKPSMS